MKYLLIVFLFFGCGKTLNERRTIKKESVLEIKDDEFTLLNSKDCEIDFLTFFEKFKNDTVFQKTHVKFPYILYYSDEDFPLDMMEDVIYKENYSSIDFSEPMYTYPHTKSPFSIDFNMKKDSVFCIKQSTLNKTIINYKFALIKGCWYLVEIEDHTD